MIDAETMEKIKPGATVSVQDKLGTFQGIVLARKHGTEAGATFTVRGAVGGVGMEKVYPLHSPTIVKVKILQSPKKMRRAKLYFVRGLSAKKLAQKLRTRRGAAQ